MLNILGLCLIFKIYPSYFHVFLHILHFLCWLCFKYHVLSDSANPRIAIGLKLEKFERLSIEDSIYE